MKKIIIIAVVAIAPQALAIFAGEWAELEWRYAHPFLSDFCVA